MSAGTKYEFTVNESVSLIERILPCAFAAQLAQGTVLVERAVALATVRAPCCAPVDESTHVMAKALGETELVELELLIATPVMVRLVAVLRDERTLPEMVAELVHGASSEMTLVVSQLIVPFETVIVARTGAVMFTVTVPVDAACAPIGNPKAVMIATAAATVRKRWVTIAS